MAGGIFFFKKKGIRGITQAPLFPLIYVCIYQNMISLTSLPNDPKK